MLGSSFINSKFTGVHRINFGPFEKSFAALETCLADQIAAKELKIVNIWPLFEVHQVKGPTEIFFFLELPYLLCMYFPQVKDKFI